MNAYKMLSPPFLTALLVAIATAATGATPAERAIARAEQTLEAQPDDARAWSALALAHARRARETSDHAQYETAASAARKSLALSPDNLEALKAEVWIQLGQHDFATALAGAQMLHRRTPDDIQICGFLVDANAELGNYGEAERAAQWMLDLRSGNVPGLTRAAYLRELFGDHDGAIDLLNQAFDRIRPGEVENRAWILTQMGRLQLIGGNIRAADTTTQAALGLFPNYHYALATLADVRTQQRRFDEAAELRRQHVRQAPHPENRLHLARALARAGQGVAADAELQRFEEAARAEMNGVDNANHELVDYYAAEGNRPDEALRIAQLEVERRRDVYTLSAQAWALHKTGQSDQARVAITAALTVGVQEAEMLYRAGAIASALSDDGTAQACFAESLRLNPHSPVAVQVQVALAGQAGAAFASTSSCTELMIKSSQPVSVESGP